jgi:LPS-assembly protein
VSGACVAYGQADLSIASGAINAIRSRNGLGQAVQNPLEPTGFPNPSEKISVLSSEVGSTPDYELIHADTQSKNRNHVVLGGNVEFLVRGYRVTCDQADGNIATRIFRLTGNVRIDGSDFDVVHGQQVTVDFINKTYEAIDTEDQLNPKLVQGQLKAPLYVKGHIMDGSQRETTTLNGGLTTCNYPAPHYEIDGDSIVVRPGKRIIFRKTKIRVLGHTILTLPFLSIPLNNKQYRNLPVIGKDPTEGYFVKTQYEIPGKNPDYVVDTREEYMSLLGLGLGGAYSYSNPYQAGTMSLYHIFGRSDDLTFSNTHKQVFRWGTLSLQNDYEKDNYLVAPGSSTFSTKLDLTLPQGRRGSDHISFSDNISSSYGYETSSDSIGLDDQRSFGSKFQSTFDMNYYGSGSSFASGTSSSSNQTSQRMNVHEVLQDDLTQAQASLEFQKAIPIGSTPTNLSSSDETPVLNLTSDARRLFGNQIGQELPFKTTLSWGDFQNPLTDSPVSRGYFDFSFARTDPTKGPFHVDVNGDFHQGIYSDGAAEYVETFGTNLRYDLSQSTGLNLRYNYMEPFGYSPLPIDQAGKTDFLSGDLNFRPFHALLVGAQSGFDFLRESEGMIGWQQIGLRTEYEPAKWFMLRGLYSYDTFAQEWSTLQFDMAYTPGATRLAMSGTFEGEEHTWTAATLYLDGLKMGRMKLAAALSYNGYLKTFDSEQFNVIYDLHCAEAVFELQQNNTGFRAGQVIQFYIRLKALPYSSPFATGTRGQTIGLPTTGTVLGG